MIQELTRQLIQSARRLVCGVAAQFTRFTLDTRAGALIYVTVTLPVIVGFSLLAIDGSRLWSMHTSLQKAADALAIAAAAELDRFPQSIDRAEIAVVNLVENRQFMGTGAGSIVGTALTVADIQTRYFSALPATDDVSMDTLTPLTKTDADAFKTARFVEVTVQPRSMNTIFPASFLGGSNLGTAAAVAVAGNDQVVCKLMPLFICNPVEPPGNTDILDPSSIEDCARDVTCRRQLIHMRAGPGGGSTADYFPGNFGFLDMGTGANALAEALAVGSPDACFLQSGVSTEPGQATGPVEEGLNVRFGLYKNKIGSINNPESDPLTRPALNVRMAQNQSLSNAKVCKDYEPVSDTTPTSGMPLPKDGCFNTNPHTCTDTYISDGAGRLGDGNWGQTEMDAYWLANFGTSPAPLNSILTYIGYTNTGGVWTDPDGNPVVDSNGLPASPGWGQITRYHIYNYEIDEPISGSELFRQLSPVPNDESGDPMVPPGSRATSCYSGGALTLTRDPDRRILNGAILNCLALEAAGFKLKGKQTGLPVAAFGEFFVTEPLRNAPTPKPPTWNNQNSNAIWAELVRVVKQGQGGNATSLDQVQLYR